MGGLWVFTRSGESEALFNWEDESIRAVELLSEEALQNEAVIYCGPSEGLRRLIEGSGAGISAGISAGIANDRLILGRAPRRRPMSPLRTLTDEWTFKRRSIVCVQQNWNFPSSPSPAALFGSVALFSLFSQSKLPSFVMPQRGRNLPGWKCFITTILLLYYFIVA